MYLNPNKYYLTLSYDIIRCIKKSTNTYVINV